MTESQHALGPWPGPTAEPGTGEAEPTAPSPGPGATPPADEEADQEADREAGRAEVLEHIRTAFADGIPVVNYVYVTNLSAPADPPPGNRRRSRPTDRIEFTGWVAIPWRDRPMEARLADVAHAIGAQIGRSPAWRHTLLDTQRVRLDPTREAADIAYAAYRLYRLRLELGPRPAGPANPVLAQAQQLFDQHFAALEMGWLSLVDRVATLASYRAHLAELAPILAAQATVHRLTDVRLDSDMTSVFADTARNELASADTRDLQDGVDGLGGALVAVLGSLDRDVRELSALTHPGSPG